MYYYDVACKTYHSNRLWTLSTETWFFFQHISILNSWQVLFLYH